VSGPNIVPGERLRDDDAGPDYRFTLANERTYLAYVRTSLAFFAAGTAVLGYLEHVLGSRALAIVIGSGLYALGIFTAATCYHRWRRLETAMLQGKPLPFSLVPPVISVSLTVLAVIAFVGAVTR
jgi:putative membrane protein